MENNMDLFYNAPKTEKFYRDCLEHAVSFRVDMMPDASWRRVLSDKPIQWMFENFNLSRDNVFLQKKHIMESEKEKWNNKTSHLEARFTIRINNIDYIALIELDIEFLSDFILKYQLTSK